MPATITGRLGRGMSARRRRRLLLGVFAGLVLVLVLFLALQAWLSSGVGRGVVESRLSDAFGRPVRLDGDFRVGLLPVPGASGTGMKLYTPDGRWLVLEAGTYLAKLALGPLLKGEVEVIALGLGEAGLDLARLASGQGVGADGAGPFSQIPAVRSFELDEVALYFDGMHSQPHIRISSLSVNDFEVDVLAPFVSRVSLVSGEAEAVELSLRGRVALRSEGAVEADLSSIDIFVDGWGATGLEGRVVGDLARSQLHASMSSKSSPQPFGVATRIAWDPVFSGGESGYFIEEFQLESGEQLLAGSGCLIDGTPPVLHLSLASAHLDLDALQALIEGLRRPDHGTSQATQAEMAEDSGLPFELAFLMEVENATFENATAQGVRLRAGPSPACPDLDW